MDTLLRDLRLAIRMLHRRAGFAALAVFVLALAIGANSAIFSVVQGVLLREPGFHEPSRLVAVWEHALASGRERNVVGPYSFTRWRERARSFQDMAAFRNTPINLTGSGTPERLDSGRVTGNLFSVLGVKALIGRPLEDADSKPGAPDVVALSEGLWRRRFGADPQILGRSLILDGEPFTVVGVMPQAVQMPAGAEVWVPITVDEQLRNARGRWMTVVGRLAPGITLAQARDEMVRLGKDLTSERPAFNTGWSVSVFPLHADLVREVRPALGILTGAVVLLLLVACANVANLLLVRAMGREREVAIRSALGAGPGRLIRQLLTESLVLALLGGAAGLLLANFALQVLVTMLPEEVRLISRIVLDPQVVAFTFGLSVLSAIVFGLVPALQQARPSLVPALKMGGSVRGASQRQRRLKGALVVSEVAVSLLLAAGAGVLLRSFWNLTHVDPGFRPEGVLTVQVDLPNSYDTEEKQAAFFQEVVGRLGQLPGVRSAAAISWIPFSLGSATSFILPDRPLPPAGQEPGGAVRMVTPGFFKTMGIPFREGRDFEPGDTRDRPRVVIVNETLAREFWPGQSPIGKRLDMEWGPMHNATVIGLVGDVRLSRLDAAARPTAYWAESQITYSFMTLLVRTDGDPMSLAGAVRGQIAAMDPELPPGAFVSLQDVLEGSVERQAFLLRLILAFAFVALLLAAVGVYGVLSHTVQERVPELGVRLAVGARPRDIMMLVLRDGLWLGATGVGVGLLGSLAGARVLEGLVFGVAPRDPLAFAAVAVVLLATVAAAAALPALRAGQVEPLKALRLD